MRIIVKIFEAACWETACWENPKLGNFEKQFGSGSGSKKKFGLGRVAGTRQGLLVKYTKPNFGTFT